MRGREAAGKIFNTFSRCNSLPARRCTTVHIGACTQGESWSFMRIFSCSCIGNRDPISNVSFIKKASPRWLLGYLIIYLLWEISRTTALHSFYTVFVLSGGDVTAPSINLDSIKLKRRVVSPPHHSGRDRVPYLRAHAVWFRSKTRPSAMTKKVQYEPH